MRVLRRQHLLTALPFLLLYAADEVGVSTRVEDDATGVRSVKITSRPDTRPYVKAFASGAKIDQVLGQGPGRRLDRRDVAGSYRVSGDLRFVDGKELGDVKVARRTRLATWPLLQTTYTYTDKITRTEFAETEREVAAAPSTELAYSVTMPGAIDQGSVLPPDGLVAGNTVTWKLKADKGSQDISVTASRPDWAPQIVLLLILLLGLLSVLRFLHYRERVTPKRI